MPQGYTPGLTAAWRLAHRSTRTLPLAGEVLVRPGQTVSAEEIVARTLLPGDITPVNVARALSIPPAELEKNLLKKAGDAVRAGEMLARSPGIFGWFRAECLAPAEGTIESVSNVTGQVILRGRPLAVELRAYLSGTVVEVTAGESLVIKGDATLIQGIFGIGGEAYGPLMVVCDDPAHELSADLFQPEHAGAIALGGARVTAEALARAVELKVAAIVTGGIDDADLRGFLGYDLGVATTGSEQKGLTLILTEGFGDIAMAARTHRILSLRRGRRAAVNGATQIRAGVQRPEIIVPWRPGENEPFPEKDSSPGHAAGVLGLGAAVRIIRDPHFGTIGAISALPPEPQWLGSGSKARVLEVRTAAGMQIVVPRANVELLEG